MANPLQDENELRKLLDDVAQRVKKAAPGLYDEAVAAAEEQDQPAPRKGDFEKFGIAVETTENVSVGAGNAGVNFPIQSISKVFALEVALEALGEGLWKRLGREPSGDPFNSIIDLERAKGIPRNPFINAGALVVCDVLVGLGGARSDRHVGKFIARQLGEKEIALDDDVMKSDRKGGELNRSLMFMASHFGNLKHDIERVMDAYVRQCAISLDCRGLARAGRFLMHDDDGDETHSVRSAQRARRILSIMMLCGQYDGSGDFAYRVGLPAKSGVGGGILAIAPHRASIAVWSPALDPMGNSWLGTLGLELLAQKTDWSVFGMARSDAKIVAEA